MRRVSETQSSTGPSGCSEAGVHNVRHELPGAEGWGGSSRSAVGLNVVVWAARLPDAERLSAEESLLYGGFLTG